MPVYNVNTLDVWGNAVDGFEVNNQFSAGTVYVPPNGDVVQILVDAGHLNESALAEHSADTLQVEHGDGTIEISETQTDEAAPEDGEGEMEVVSAQFPLLILEEARLTHDPMFPVWRTSVKRSELKGVRGRRLAFPYTLDVIASLDSPTEPRVIRFEVSASLSRTHSGGGRTPESDSFDFWYADWVRGKGKIGVDLFSSEELDLGADHVRLLVAIDSFLETGKEFSPR